ncbi:MAG: hypothetical protein ACFWTZ_02390 [Burkholderia sp.]|jgi:lipopolysaccharide biosynthesis glycosyltransferase
MAENINIVLTADGNYVYPLGVCMTSIILNLNKENVANFFLFVKNFSEEQKKELLKLKDKYNCIINFIDVSSYEYIFQSIDEQNFRLQYISKATMYRLLMFYALPNDIEKCIYVDGDMIIDGDLSEVYDSVDKNILLSCVIEILAMRDRTILLRHLYNIKEFQNFKHNPNKFPYFNAGFFIVNLALSRKFKIFEQLIDFMNRNPDLPYADQDILNAILGQKYRDYLNFLDPCYNVFCDISYKQSYPSEIYSNLQIKEAFYYPFIYHFAGGNKPWINENCQNHRDIWWHYANLSPWSKIINKKCRKIFIANHTITDKYYIFGFIPVCKIIKINEGWKQTKKINFFGINLLEYSIFH